MKLERRYILLPQMSILGNLELLQQNTKQAGEYDVDTIFFSEVSFFLILYKEDRFKDRIGRSSI